jgi:hypothetical protein
VKALSLHGTSQVETVNLIRSRGLLHDEHGRFGSTSKAVVDALLSERRVPGSLQSMLVLLKARQIPYAERQREEFLRKEIRGYLEFCGRTNIAIGMFTSEDGISILRQNIRAAREVDCDHHDIDDDVLDFVRSLGSLYVCLGQITAGHERFHEAYPLLSIYLNVFGSHADEMEVQRAYLSIWGAAKGLHDAGEIDDTTGHPYEFRHLGEEYHQRFGERAVFTLSVVGENGEELGR